MSFRYNKPLEMPRGSHFGSDYWVAYSKKINRKCCFFSLLEYANFLHLEMDSSIKYFCEQPLKIYSDKDPKKSAIFDFWVLYSGGTEEFQEIKYSKELSDFNENRSQKQIALQKEWCRQNGFNYIVRSEKELLNSCKYMNLKRMHYIICNTNYDFVPDNVILGILKNYKKITIKELCYELNIPMLDILQLISIQYYLGYIDLDLTSRPIDYRMEICLCQDANLI